MAKTYGNWAMEVDRNQFLIAQRARREWTGRIGQSRRGGWTVLLSVLRGIIRSGYPPEPSVSDTGFTQQAADEIRNKAYLDIARIVR